MPNPPQPTGCAATASQQPSQSPHQPQHKQQRRRAVEPIISEEADALVESFTSYVEETVGSVTTSLPGLYLPSTHQLLGNFVENPNTRPTSSAYSNGTTPTAAGNNKTSPGSGGETSFFSCVVPECTEDATIMDHYPEEAVVAAHVAETEAKARLNSIHHNTNKSAIVHADNNGGVALQQRQQRQPNNNVKKNTIPPRTATMEEPYFSDELNTTARDVEALKKSVNDMLLRGDTKDSAVAAGGGVTSGGSSVGSGSVGSGSAGGRTLPIGAKPMPVVRSRSLITGKLPTPPPSNELDLIPSRTADTTDSGDRSRGGSVSLDSDPEMRLLRGPAEADCPPADPEPPEHERWAIAAPTVDLSGDWTIIADDRFRKEYAAYLANLGFGRLLRNVALTVIGSTTEQTRQEDEGRTLLIRGKNPRGVWERTLISSGFPDFDTHARLQESVHYEHRKVMVLTADSEEVEAEAWWEKGGTVHRSWLRGGSKYGGGDFESYRSLEDDGGKVLVCHSIFHPNDKTKPRAEVTWRYLRDGSS